VIAPKLLIRKRMLTVQGRVRPCCFVQAIVDPAIQGILETHFLAENLFRRAAYAMNWPAGTIKVPPSLAPSLSALLKSDACPEISVKTILTGQTHQAANVWEMMSFELVAKVAFDNIVQLATAVTELDRDIFYAGSSQASDIAKFQADMSAEIVALDANDRAA
jgi:hypothetical protein